MSKLVPAEFPTRRLQSSTLPLSKSLNGRRVWTIKRGAVRSLQLGANEMLRVQVLSGASWITIESDAEDHVLLAGGSQTFRGPGQFVAEALHAGTSLRLES